MIKRTLLVPKTLEECEKMPGCGDCSMAFWDNCQEVLENLTEMFEDE
jgi:hypothetical protein